MTKTAWIKEQEDLAAQYRQAETDYIAAKNLRNGALFINAKERMNAIEKKLREHGE